MKDEELILKAVEYCNDIPARVKDFLKTQKREVNGVSLIEEAKRRGFKNGTHYKFNDCTATMGDIDNLHAMWFEDEGWHITDGCGGWIYDSGKWAEIIPDKKKLPTKRSEFVLFLEDYTNRDNYVSRSEFLDQYTD